MEKREGGLATIEGAEPLLLVGAGKMGGAMLDRWLASGLDARQVTILDPFLETERRARLAAAGAVIAADAGSAGGRAFRTLVLAVKPQSLAEVLPLVAPLAGPET